MNLLHLAPSKLKQIPQMFHKINLVAEINNCKREELLPNDA